MADTVFPRWASGGALPAGNRVAGSCGQPGVDDADNLAGIRWPVCRSDEGFPGGDEFAAGSGGLDDSGPDLPAPTFRPIVYAAEDSTSL
jgi:hypothetical protein